MKKYFIFIALAILLFSISSACAEEIGDNSTAILEVDDTQIEVDHFVLKDSGSDENTDSSYLEASDDNELQDSSDVIVVKDWDELKKYAGRADKNYVVKLKENTNFYPSSPTDKSCQIKIRNNLTIIGSEGAYFGEICKHDAYIDNKGHIVVEDSSPITYIPIVVPDDNKIGLTLENITFQWIYTQIQPDGIFLKMGGNANNVIKNCVFKNINTFIGHSCIVYIKRGDALLENCSFINCTTDFGAVSIFDPDVPETSLHSTARMVVKNCYFENNFARTEPGAINNCGLLIAYNSTFINNRATVWAGAIHTHGGANTTLYNCEFIDNVAGWNGGALYTYSYLQIYNSTFRGNNCTTNNGGGAIGACTHLTSPHIYITDSIFERNTNNCWALDLLSTDSLGRGGAISFMDSGSLEVRNSIFIANSAYIGTAICASEKGTYGSPTVIIEGNTFINHNRAGDLLVVVLKGTTASISNNTYYNNSIEFKNISFSISEPIDKKVNVTILSKLKNPSYYDSDILDKCNYSIYVDGKYKETINGNMFTLNFEDIETCKFYVVPSIYNGRSEEITLTIPREYIYVSKENGNDANNGLKETPVYSLSRAIELAKTTENIILLDGEYNEENLLIDYRLTIWGTNNSSIANLAINKCMFNVKNSKFTLKNITISDLKMIDESSRFITGETNRIYINNCIVESNTFNNFIDSSLLGITDTLFKNNKISLNIKNLTITNSNFINNTATLNYALFNSNFYGNDWDIIDSNFSNNNGLLINYSSKSNELNIMNSIFNNNFGIEQVSGIKLDDFSKLNIESTIFLNNDYKLPIIYTNTNVIIAIKNSIILNNSIDNDIIGGNMGSVDCNYNWWGNTLENINIAPNSLYNLENWLFLNMSNPNYVEHGKEYVCEISLNNLITKDNKTSVYKQYNLPPIMLMLNGENISINTNYLNLINGKAEAKFTLNNLSNGSFSVKYENIASTISFNFIKSVPTRIIKSNDILVGNDGYVEITLPNDATGNVSIMVNNINKDTKSLKNSNVSFNLKNLSAGAHNISIIYSGDDKYLQFEDIIIFLVNKYESNIKINVGDIEVNEDVILTLELPEDATGNASLIINNDETIFNIENSRSYTIKNITRGDWIIKAIYYGDLKYNFSEDNIKLAVSKFNASMIINLFDISYGEDAEVQIIVDNDATGNVTAIIDDKNKTEQLIKGKATIVISNLTAGYKNIQVKYTGDQNYNEKTYSSRFYINQIPTHFNITTTNALEGKNSIVELTIPEGVEGTFTITVGNITDIVDIPKYGQVTWLVSNLPAGNYTVTATYNGQNYKTCKNQAQLSVYPWKNTQWPNMGYDSQNSGKSPYNSTTNGELNWTIETNEEIIGNIAIDSNGNICIITTKGIYSFDKNGNQNWKYNSRNSIFSGIAIGREVVISPVSGDTLYFINQTSGQKYGYSNIWQGSSVFIPVIDEKGNLYISGEKIYDTGKYDLVIVPYDAWEYGGQVSIDLGDSAPTTAPVVVNDNIVCVGTEKGLKLIDISQEKVISNLNIITNVRPVVGDGGIIYALTSDELIAIDSAGNQLWKSNTSGEAKYLAIDNENGLLYSIDKQGNLYKYDILDNGAKTLISNLNVTSGILIGNDGTLYLGADTTFIALDSNGEFLWKSNIGETITGTPVMDADGNIYVTGNTTLFALTNAPLKDANLSIETANVVYGNDVKFNITLNNEATGEISVTINENTYIFNGNAEISIPNLTAGSYDVIVSYTGDKRFSSSQKTLTVNVTKIEAPASNITIPAEINTDNPSFSIELSSDATGILTVSVDGVKYSSQLNNGKATVDIPKLPSGVHNIVVTYSGDNNYDPITTSKTVMVPSPAAENPDAHTTTAGDSGASIEKTSYVLKIRNYKVKKSAKKLVLKATLKSSNGKPIKGKTITFKLNGKTYKAKTNKNGIAKVTIKKNVIKKLKVKKYTLKITYLKTTIKKTVTIKK